TGGSSQIPLFVGLLQERFGADKVLEIDAFGSVTSGLGVIGHRLEQDDIQLTAYHADDYSGTRNIRAEKRSDVPIVDLAVIKRVIDVQEFGDSVSSGETTLLMRDKHQRLFATNDVDFSAEIPHNHFTDLDEDSFFHALSPDNKVVLMTTKFRCYTKLAGDLADLCANNLHIE